MKASEEDKNRLRAQPVIDASLKRAMQKLTGIRQQYSTFFEQKFSMALFHTEKDTEDKLIELYLMLEHADLLQEENLKHFEASKACELKPVWAWNQLSDLDRLINILSLMKDNVLSQENTLLTQKNLTWVLEQSDLHVVEIIFKQLSDENKLDEAFIIFIQDKMTKTHAECIQYINKAKKLTASILEKVLESKQISEMKDILKLLDTANIVSSDKIDIESLMSATDLTLVLENLVLLSGFLDVDIYNKVVLSTCLDDLKDAIIKIKPWLDKNSVSLLVSLPKPDLVAEMCVELPVPKGDKGVFTDGKAPIMHRFLKDIARFNPQFAHLDPVRFRRCLIQFKDANLVTSENLISLVCHNDLLLDLLPQISITQPILTDFFKICESETGATSGVQRQLENYVAKLRAEADTKRRKVDVMFQQFFGSSLPQFQPQPPEYSSLEAIKAIIKEGHYQHQALFRAFHTDHHNRTLKDAFDQLRIKQPSVKKEHHFLFKDEILLSEAMFLTIVQELIPFIKELKELNIELKESGAASTSNLRV